MTKDFVRERYEMSNDKISTGRFCGQPWQAVAFHLLALQGCYDLQRGDGVYYFNLTPHDRSTYDIPLRYNRARLTILPNQVTIEFD